ncbi:VOC family protein [Planctomicrobium sp. SH664]|uniref:VOC family protein n=1 Tax=Planctomicrobium sp. SH664 TaxID=3448125 RepID=UPI003F5C7D81
MATKIFVNLAVKDLNRSKEFYQALGYSFNPQFTDDTAACLVISDQIYAMLLTHDKFQGFAPGEICDSSKSNEALLALSCDSREAVDAMISKAIQAGGKTYREPMDHGFMYWHAFQDPDGHAWEHFWMNEAALPAG